MIAQNQISYFSLQWAEKRKAWWSTGSPNPNNYLATRTRDEVGSCKCGVLGDSSTQSKGRVIPLTPELSDISDLWKKSGMGQRSLQPPLLYHPLLFITLVKNEFFSAVTPHMDSTFFFWRREKSSEEKESHSTSAVPKDPSTDVWAGIPEWNVLQHLPLSAPCSPPASLPPWSPPAASAVSQPLLGWAGWLLCCAGRVSASLPLGQRGHSRVQAHSLPRGAWKAAPGLRKCPVLLHPCFALNIPDLTAFAQVQWVKHFPALSGKPALHRIGQEMQLKSWQGKHEQKKS